MKALGIIFSDIQDWSMTELATNRSVAAIPFGGRYRLIDFPLSNMVNSGTNKICIITKSNYRSLMEHVASGKDWDLSRKKGGILIFPPYAVGENHGLYKGRLDALKRVLDYISYAKEKYVVLSDCDMIYNINYEEVIKYHEEKNSDITAVYTNTDINKSSSVHKILYEFDEEGRAEDILVYPTKVERLGLPEKYPETFEDQIPMPKECEDFDDGFSGLKDLFSFCTNI